MSETGIRAVIETRRRALRDRDPAAFLVTYAPDALIFDLAPPLAHGLDAQGVAAWMASWDGPIGSETHDLRVEAAGPLALVTCLERLHGLQGGEARDIWMRLTLCLRRDHGGWRVTHEHVSVPVRKVDGRLIGATDLRPDPAPRP
jgi:ketosteroid isomerase-like protein